MYRIGILSHYSSMEKDFMHLQGWEGCQLIFKMGVLDLAIEVARKMIEQERVEAIIANSKTAAFIRPYLSVPVIPLYLKTYNLIRAFHLAKTVGNKIAFVEYDNETQKDASVYDLDIVQQILNIKVNRYQAADLSLMPEVLEILIRDGCDTVVSSASCMIARASRSGLHTFLMKTEEGDMQEAILNAANMLKIQAKDAERRDWLTSIVENSDSGYLILSRTGLVNLVNERATELLELPASKLEGHHFQSLAEKYPVIEQLSRCTKKMELIKYLDQELLVQYLPVQSQNSNFMGTLYVLNKLKNIQDTELQARRLLLKKGFIAKYQFHDIVGESTHIKSLIQKAKLFARTNAPVLIHGESGTGKELFAQSIHNASPRARKPFLAINCATLPPQLLESELFGYEGGAFTDARKDGKLGLFEVANGGTVFLDEIGEMPPELQARLLRVLQEKEIRRVGGDSNIAIDVRIISATHRNLRKAVAERQFRGDLYYRLNILPLELPPLRSRPDDIAPLISSYLQNISLPYPKRFKMPAQCLSEMEHYAWPGNVRELYAFMERLVATAQSDAITVQAFHDAFRDLTQPSDAADHGADDNTISVPIGTYQEMNRDIVLLLLEHFHGDRRAVEQTLNISPTTLWRRIKEK